MTQGNLAAFGTASGFTPLKTMYNYGVVRIVNGELKDYDDGIAIDTDKVYANSFIGNLTGNATSATSATKLSSSAGSATQPIYFSDGKPVACTYSLNKTVPANAVFTDTVYTLPTATTSVLGGVKLGSDTIQTVAANSVTSTASRTYAIQKNSSNQLVVNVPWTDTNTTYSFSASNPTLSWGTTSTIGTAGGVTYKVTMPSNPNTDTHYTAYNYVGAAGSASNAATSNGSTYLKLYENGTKRSQFLIKGSNANLVTSDSSGNITINSKLVGVQTSYNSSTSGSSGIKSIGCRGYDIEYDPYGTTSASSHKMLFIRSGHFQSTGTGSKTISFTSPMKMNSISAIYVTVYLHDAANMSQNGAYKNAHNITATSSTGFSCYIDNSETGTVHFLAIGYNFY